jgi:hypothetical protein
MTPSVIYYSLGIAVIVIGGLNAYLTLRLENRVLTMRQEILDDCERKFAPERDTDRRLVALEARHAA